MRRLQENKFCAALSLLMTTGAALSAQEVPASIRVPLVETAVPAKSDESRTVDLAICLDTSGSMSGLINAARAGIWAIVSDLALAKPTPKMRVALLTFGNSGHDPAAGWVKVGTGFTEDLDLVSQQLFGLTTNGGTEYVGRVVQTSVDQLDWSKDPHALKLIVVAGNESADQDREVTYPDACRAAIGRGIQINAIYCGNESHADATAWGEVAKLADGRFHSIDHNEVQVAIPTPFDAQLRALNVKLNATYVPFGSDGRRGWSNQVAQDKNAESCSTGVLVSRAMAKSTSNYCNTSWDLIDACKAQTVKLEEVEDADLPEAMRGKTLEEKRAHLDSLGKSRAALQVDIQKLSKQRSAFVTAERKKQALDSGRSFDGAVCEAVRAQAEAKGMTFAKEEPVLPPAPPQGAPKPEPQVPATVESKKAKPAAPAGGPAVSQRIKGKIDGC